MRISMRIATLFTLVTGFAVGAQAQSGMWGAGVYGGMQACPYPYAAAEGSSSHLDDIKEAQEAISEAQKQIREKKSEKRRLTSDLAKARKNVEGVVREEFTTFMFDHIENTNKCTDYAALAVDPKGSVSQVAEGGKVVTPTKPDGTPSNGKAITGFSLEQWKNLCDPNKPGAVSGAVCDGADYRQPTKGRATAQDCKTGLIEYRNKYTQSGKLQSEIEALENAVRQAKDNIKDSRKSLAEERREQQREAREAQLEGGVCVGCIAQGAGYQYRKPETDMGSVLGNFALGGISLLAGYQTNKMIAGYNAQNGWETNPYASMGYGYGLGAIGTGIGQLVGGGSGIYGSMSGGIGAGAFGCAGNNGGPYGMAGPYGGMNGNGMWGNPYGMAGLGGLGGGMGGGIYLPGMGRFSGHSAGNRPDADSRTIEQRHRSHLRPAR